MIMQTELLYIGHLVDNATTTSTRPLSSALSQKGLFYPELQSGIYFKLGDKSVFTGGDISERKDNPAGTRTDFHDYRNRGTDARWRRPAFLIIATV